MTTNDDMVSGGAVRTWNPPGRARRTRGDGLGSDGEVEATSERQADRQCGRPVGGPWGSEPVFSVRRALS